MPGRRRCPSRRLPSRGPQVELADEGIAIIGIGCRFPGAEDPGEFWRLLAEGVDRGRGGTRWGRFLDRIVRRSSGQRSSVFGTGHSSRVSSNSTRGSSALRRSRRASWIRTSASCWRRRGTRLEDAGIDPGDLRGSRTGVYVGLGGSEYREVIAASDYEDSFVGTSASMTVGRLAFAFGLEGPAIPLDAVCASSLVAVHQAMAGLQHGEVDMALVGGVNIPLSRGVTRFLNDVGMLSANGRTRSFDAAADGFVRSDGCGMVVLKRLRDAEAADDRIWGVIRGSAINQNGASAGLTVPNGPAQERVLRDALARAGAAPSDVDYLEAHGGASTLGDPIEVRAAATVYGQGRDPRPSPGAGLGQAQHRAFGTGGGNRQPD